MTSKSDLPFGGRWLVIDADLPTNLVQMLVRNGIKAKLTRYRNLPPASKTFGARTQPDALIAKEVEATGDILVTRNYKDIRKIAGFGRAGTTVIAAKGLVAQNMIRLTQELINLGERFRMRPSFYKRGSKWILSNEGLRRV